MAGDGTGVDPEVCTTEHDLQEGLAKHNLSKFVQDILSQSSPRSENGTPSTKLTHLNNLNQELHNTGLLKPGYSINIKRYDPDTLTGVVPPSHVVINDDGNDPFLLVKFGVGTEDQPRGSGTWYIAPGSSSVDLVSGMQVPAVRKSTSCN